MICPWCEFPITGVPAIPRFVLYGRESAGYNATCQHCRAIIRVEVTTLHLPEARKDDKGNPIPLRANVTEQQEAARKQQKDQKS